MGRANSALVVIMCLRGTLFVQKGFPNLEVLGTATQYIPQFWMPRDFTATQLQILKKMPVNKLLGASWLHHTEWGPHPQVYEKQISGQWRNYEEEIS